MSQIDCNACAELREIAPEFVQNGVTSTVCTSLKNDTGLNPNLTVAHTDCEDLDTANDCLIGEMDAKIEAHDVCDWKQYMHKLVPNLYEMLKAMICAMCGLWTNIHRLWNQVTISSYIGILTLYTTTRQYGDGEGNQAPAFNTNVKQGNIPASVLTVASDYKGIVVNNTTSVPLLVETTFNSSIATDQHICCCFIVVTKDGYTVGQTPFITPGTYDQQVVAEPFILQPGASCTMRYYFRVGDANNYFLSQFGRPDSQGLCQCVLDPNVSSNPENQRSYFSVKVTSIVS